ncbi:MAG: SRPBCC family protein [Nitrospirota bacterium]
MLRIAAPFSEIGSVLHASPGEVWDLLTDTSRWHEWGPSVKAVDCMDRYILKGSRGRIKIPLGIWVPFVITDFEDTRYWSWRIFGIQATGHRIEPLDDVSCNLFFSVPALGAPYLILCWIAIRRIEAMLQHVR